MDACATSFLSHGFGFLVRHLRWLLSYLAAFARRDPAQFERYVSELGRRRHAHRRLMDLTCALIRRTVRRVKAESIILQLLENLVLVGALVLGRTLDLVRHFFGELFPATGKFVRRCTVGNFASIPPLIATIVIVFMTSDTWKILGNGFGWRFTLLVAVFAMLALAVLVPAGFHASFVGTLDDLDTPAAVVVTYILETRGVPVPFADKGSSRGRSRRVRRRVVLLNLWIFLTDFLVIAASVATLLIVVGVIVVDKGSTATFRGGARAVDVLAQLPFLHMVVTKDLLSLSLSLGAFAAFYFAVVALPDQRARAAFARQATDGIRRGLAALVVYDVARGHELTLTGVSRGSQAVDAPHHAGDDFAPPVAAGDGGGSPDAIPKEMVG
jgi:hypothetical protein